MSVTRPTNPIPEQAKQVFQGEIFSVYQWEQPLFDGTTATFERLKRSDTVVIVPITEDGQVLMIEEQQPDTSLYLSVPAGRLEEGEEPEAGALRELEEETGYTAGRLELWKALQPLRKIDWAIYLFVAKECKKTGEQKLDSGEKITLKPVALEEFWQMVVSDPEGFRVREIAWEILQAEIDPTKKAKLQALFTE